MWHAYCHGLWPYSTSVGSHHSPSGFDIFCFILSQAGPLSISQIQQSDGGACPRSRSLNRLNEFCAHRLRVTLPVLLDTYRNNEPTHGLKNTISRSDLIALEELSDRLSENASRTKSTVEIIQTTIGSGTKPLTADRLPVRPLIEEALRSGVRESINHQAHIELTGNDFCITAQKGPMVHVFINLLKNSLEAMQGTDHPKIEIALCEEASSLSIIDNGEGISTDIISRIFEENFTTKKGGNGKGLHFCKMILAEFGASIGCESRPGKTEFPASYSINLTKRQ